MRRVYLDNSATTRPYDEVVDTMAQVMREQYGNPSSLHRMGMEAEGLLKAARTAIADTLATTPDRILFTSGGTESDNLAIFGTVSQSRVQGGKVITTAVEHPAVLRCFDRLREQGYEVITLGLTRTGMPDLAALRQALDERTILVSMMLVNNELGTIFPVQQVRAMLTEQKCPAMLHCDAVQGYAKLPFTAASLGADLISLSSHKIHGPKGVGALYVGPKVKLVPQMLGGGQEGGLRSGTENLQSIVGFAKAAQITFADLPGHLAHLRDLNDYARAQIEQRVDRAVIHSAADGAPHVLNLSLPGLPSEVMLHHLESRGVFVSAGSACSAKKRKVSHVLASAGFSDAELKSALRVSFGHFNTKEDCDALVEGLCSCRRDLLELK